MELAELVDRELITRTLRRYSQGVDQRQWPVFHSAFAEGATVKIPGYFEGAITPVEFERMLAGTFDNARLSGQHFLGNTIFRFGEAAADNDGDGGNGEGRNGEARATTTTTTTAARTTRTVTEFLAVTSERAGDDNVAVQHSAGLYVDDLVKLNNDWRILRRTLVRKSDEVRTVPYGESQWTAVASASSNTVTAGL